MRGGRFMDGSQAARRLGRRTADIDPHEGRHPLADSASQARPPSLWHTLAGETLANVSVASRIGFGDLLGDPTVVLASFRMATALHVLFDGPLRKPIDRQL